MFRRGNKKYSCPLEVTLDILGGSRKCLILWFLHENKKQRYGEIKRFINNNSIKNVSDKMLIHSLNQLIEDKIVSKKIYPVMPPKTEYSLTRIGLKSKKLINSLENFGTNFLDK